MSHKLEVSGYPNKLGGKKTSCIKYEIVNYWLVVGLCPFSTTTRYYWVKKEGYKVLHLIKHSDLQQINTTAGTSSVSKGGRKRRFCKILLFDILYWAKSHLQMNKKKKEKKNGHKMKAQIKVYRPERDKYKCRTAVISLSSEIRIYL